MIREHVVVGADGRAVGFHPDRCHGIVRHPDVPAPDNGTFGPGCSGDRNSIVFLHAEGDHNVALMGAGDLLIRFVDDCRVYRELGINDIAAQGIVRSLDSYGLPGDDRLVRCHVLPDDNQFIIRP